MYALVPHPNFKQQFNSCLGEFSRSTDAGEMYARVFGAANGVHENVGEVRDCDPPHAARPRGGGLGQHVSR